MKYEVVSFRANHITLEGFKIINSGEDEVTNIGAVRSVSYTHLDVYKRQLLNLLTVVM